MCLTLFWVETLLGRTNRGVVCSTMFFSHYLYTNNNHMNLLIIRHDTKPVKNIWISIKLFWFKLCWDSHGPVLTPSKLAYVCPSVCVYCLAMSSNCWYFMRVFHIQSIPHRNSRLILFYSPTSIATYLPDVYKSA